MYTESLKITFEPKLTKDIPEFNCFECPLYITRERRGQLTTIGHSNNFILNINLKTKDNKKKWIKRGTGFVVEI